MKINKNIVVEGKYSNSKIIAFFDKIWIDIPPVGFVIDNNTVFSYQILRYNSVYYYIQLFWKEGSSVIQIVPEYFKILKKAVDRVE